MTIVAEYDYTDEQGRLLYQAVRLAPKSFWQRQPDGRGGHIWSITNPPVRRVLYRLPDLLAADANEWIYIPEGEKDVDNAVALGLVATCNVSGAGKWLPEYGEPLRDRKVCILPDNDEPGQNHARKVAESIYGVAAEVRILNLPGLAAKGDLSDWLAQGGTADQLRQLTQIAAPHKPELSSTVLPNSDAPKAKPAPARQHEPDDLVERIKAHYSALDVFRHHGWANEQQRERNGSIRLLGHGGLIVGDPDNPATRWQWYHHGDQVGGDQIDAWAHCSRRHRDSDFLDILDDMAYAAGIVIPVKPPPLPPGATINGNGTVSIKTTPLPARAPAREPPAMTPEVCAQLAQVLNSPAGRRLLAAHIDSRMRETFVRAALQLVTVIAPAMNGWVFDMDSRTLGEWLGKSHMSAQRNLHKFNDAGLVIYSHAPAPVKAGDFAPMRVDLRPLVVALSQEKNENVPAPWQVDSEYVPANDQPVPAKNGWNVFATFSGNGEYADASMRVHPIYRGVDGRTLPSLTDAALNALALVARGDLSVTRRMLVEDLGMSQASAAGATKRWEAIGLCTVEHEERRKVYIFSSDWVTTLQQLTLQMVSFNAHYRLRINHVNDLIDGLDKRIARLSLGSARRDLAQRREKLKAVRKRLIDRMQLRATMARADHVDNCQPISKPYRRPAPGPEGRFLQSFIHKGKRTERLWGIAI